MPLSTHGCSQCQRLKEVHFTKINQPARHHIAKFGLHARQGQFLRAGRLEEVKRTRASAKDNEKDDLLSSLDSEQYPFKRPKFQAFVGQTDTGKLLQAFRHKAQVKEGQLLIKPLDKDWLESATCLLTESFADAVGYMPMYRGFLKKQVREYLTSHISIAPKAIILEVLLLDEANADAVSVPDEASGALLRQDGDSVSWLSEEGNVETDDKGPNSPDSPDDKDSEAAYSGSSDAPDSLSLPPILNDGSMNSLMSSLDKPSFDTEVESSSNTDATWERPYLNGGGTDAELDKALLDREIESNDQKKGNSYSSFSEGKAQDMREAQEVIDSLASAPASNGSSVDSSDEASNATLEGQGQGYVTQESSSPGVGLVGTVELSFSPSTRTSTMTLNPPADGAYLCNMAVDEHFQRKGFGMRMLSAAEDIVELAGFRRIWLHVRLKDDAAMALYQKAGYEVEQEDCILVGLWNDRRQLLSKFIPKRHNRPKKEEKKEPVQEAVVAEYWQ